mgnify:CR=1 FL=1
MHGDAVLHGQDELGGLRALDGVERDHQPDGVAARGVAEIAGLRVGLSGKAYIELLDGVPIVQLGDLDVGGVYQWRRRGEKHLLDPMAIAMREAEEGKFAALAL